MRYEDWDVLLFPAGDDPTSHVPMQEFRTACSAIRDPRIEAARADGVTPLMTTFIPSLHEGSPFQLSVHSWGTRSFAFTPNLINSSFNTQHVWQLKLSIDKVVVCVQTFPAGGAWPKVICAANAPDVSKNGELQPLRFPPFHRTVMSQRTWDANDMTGRIKLEITEGFLGETADGIPAFAKFASHVTFNFQPAPLDILQRAGIAWPNPQMFRETQNLQPVHRGSVGHAPAPRIRSASGGSVGSPWSSPSMPGPPPTPVSAYGGPSGHNHDSTRSTSAYTNIPTSAYPMPARHADMGHSDYPVKTRLSSDQLEQIIHAIRSPQLEGSSASASTSTSMGPPPLPQHAKETNQQEGVSDTGEASRWRPADSTADRRLANSSDTSMHPDCPLYPDCTSEDCNGHVVHNPAPAMAIRGRKEGSKDGNQRDFFSKVLNPDPAKVETIVDDVVPLKTEKPKTGSSTSNSVDTTTRKRTRSSIKALAGAAKDDASRKRDTSSERDDGKPARKVSRVSVVDVVADVQNDDVEMQG